MRRRRSVAACALVGFLAWMHAAAGAQAQLPPRLPPGGTSPTTMPAPQPAPTGPRATAPQPPQTFPPTTAPTGKAATAVSTSPAALRGALALARETALVAAMGGFGQPADQRVTTAVGSLGLAPEGADARMAALAGADAEGQAALGALANPSADVQRTLAALSAADLAALTGGQPVSLVPDQYLRALEHLLRYDGGPPPAAVPPDAAAIAAQLRQLLASPPPPPADQPAGSGPSAQQTVAVTPAAASDGSGSSPLPLLLFGLSVGVAAAVGVTLLRRRPVPAPVPPPAPRRPVQDTDLHNLLEVSRRLTAEAATGDVDRAILRHALELVTAQGAALVGHDGDAFSTRAETHPGLLIAEGLAEGAVRRVAETGQSIAQVSATEPAIRNLPAALVAVPLVSGGRVEAVLVLVRPHAEPFTNAEREVLLALAPVAAAALQSARQSRAAIEESLIDPLTGVGNRRRFDMDLGRAMQDGPSTALFMVDLDHFKSVNDTHGHPAGDALLKGVSALMVDGVRPGDTVYRFGGEEFCVLLRHTGVEEAAEVAERVRRSIAERRFGVGKPDPLRATASFGVSAAGDGDGPGLVARADQALYVAKQSGRNRVEAR
ncbi:MAG TPA: sensor domain-containing diguanylate cyclase [Acidimicrobiales bacterium]|nr:sensor domain-containing diguanylate cyclase [Acidimicrobiales bacterium]